MNYGSENHSHGELFSVLDGAVQGMLKYSKEEMEKDNSQGITLKAWRNALSGILDAYLGKEPVEFNWCKRKRQ